MYFLKIEVSTKFLLFDEISFVVVVVKIDVFIKFSDNYCC